MQINTTKTRGKTAEDDATGINTDIANFCRIESKDVQGPAGGVRSAPATAAPDPLPARWAGSYASIIDRDCKRTRSDLIGELRKLRSSNSKLTLMVVQLRDALAMAEAANLARSRSQQREDLH